MHPPSANGIRPRLSFWPRVREFAVPPSMIEAATARRLAGDWRGACDAAGFDVDIDLRVLAHTHGPGVASQVLDDLRHLAPDLLRWHHPRVAPDGLLRPGLTVALSRYGPQEVRKRCGGTGSVHLVVRTAPAWADAGQRMVLALWDCSDSAHHPHPRPNRRFRLDLHRHLWDARRSNDLRIRGGTRQMTGATVLDPVLGAVIPESCAVDRWAAEARILLRADGQCDGPVRVRCGGRHDLVVEPVGGTDPAAVRLVDEYPRGRLAVLPVLPDAATWVLPDLELIRAGVITADRLHPLVAVVLEPGWSPPKPSRTPNQENRIHRVDCRDREAPDRTGRRRTDRTRSRPRRDPARRTARRAGWHSAAVSSGHRPGTSSSGLPAGCSRTPGPRRCRRGAGRRRRTTRSRRDSP